MADDQQLRYNAKDHLVQDAMGQTTIAMCEDEAIAQGIVDALNAYNAVPQRLQLQAEPDWNEVVVYSADVVKWLDAIYLMQLHPGRFPNVPIPPWRNTDG